MGRRRAGGGRNQSNLYHRVEEAYTKRGCRTLDDAVQFLRSSFPEYTRMNQQALMSNARRAFQELQSLQGSSMKSPTHTKCASYTEAEIGSSNRKINGSEEDDEAGSDSSRATPSHSRKRKKRIDMREEKLLRLEEEHLKRSRKMDAESESESETGLEDDEPTSSSEDAIYGMKFEPEFDLMKSMLRESYGGPKTESPKAEEKNLEVEDISKEKRLAILPGDGAGPKGLTPGTGRKKGDKKGSKKLVPAIEEEVIAKSSGPTFSDLGGMKSVLDELRMEVIVPLYHPQLSIWLGVKPMGGILLHGPPGCGKTKLAHAIANETGVPFYKISATEVVSGVSGASEENIRELFLKAEKTAPSIVFIDEIDAIASKRENLQREMERRIVTQLMTCMDESHRNLQSEKNSESESDQRRPGNILVIGATNRPDAVDPALRRPGRFDREIALGIPDESARLEIFSVLTRNLRLEGDFDMARIARATPGFVGADLAALTNKAGNLAMKRILDRRKSELTIESIDEEPIEEWWRKPWLPEEMQELSITMADFEEATKMVQPSLKREGFSEIPKVKWEDVGGLDTLRQEFERFIVRRIKFPEIYEECGVDMETGFLLYGPPGCGKTLIAKAVANEARASFIHIKGPELLNKWVGESESAVRNLFRRARTCAPCILFFDEVDAITKKREREGGPVVESLLNQLLIELDGGENRKGVYVIGATNRRDAMDEATLRPGRFGKHLYVPLPSPDQRVLILQALGRKKPLDDSVDLVAIGTSKSCENLSGADLASLMNEAAMAALEEKVSSVPVPDVADPVAAPFRIKPEHFEQALNKVTPSVSEKQKRFYDRPSVSFKAA